MTLLVRQSGVYVEALPSVRVSDTWENVLEGWANVGGIWEQFYTRFSVSAAPTSIAEIRTGAGSITSSAATVTAQGTGSYTYAWSLVSGDATIAIDSASSASTTFTATLGPGAIKVAIFECLVTDTGLGESLTTNTVTVDLQATGDGGG